MSMIHSNWTLVGLSASLSFGTARLRTVRSITVSMPGNARTARPSQVRAEALWVRIPRRRTGRAEIDTARQPDAERGTSQAQDRPARWPGRPPQAPRCAAGAGCPPPTSLGLILHDRLLAPRANVPLPARGQGSQPRRGAADAGELLVQSGHGDDRRPVPSSSAWRRYSAGRFFARRAVETPRPDFAPPELGEGSMCWNTGESLSWCATLSRSSSRPRSTGPSDEKGISHVAALHPPRGHPRCAPGRRPGHGQPHPDPARELGRLRPVPGPGGGLDAPAWRLSR